MPLSQPKEIFVGRELPLSPENVNGPESAAESAQVSEKLAAGSASPVLILPPTQVISPDSSGDVIILEKVEQILAENMDNVFLSLDAASQRNFKIKGEETAKKITTLFSQAKVKVKDIIKLIIEWLKIIPRVNHFYLEQEAKIKADAILHLYKK